MSNRALHAPELVDTSCPGITKTSRDSSTPPTYVDMDEVILNGEELHSMVRSLKARAKNVVARIKRAAESPHHDTIALAELAPLLLRGQTFGAQIQYSDGSGRWIDTIVVTNDGFRLVRLRVG